MISTRASTISPPVEANEVRRFSPLLADVLAVNTADGLEAVGAALLPAVMRR